MMESLAALARARLRRLLRLCAQRSASPPGVAVTYACGCRPADTWCRTARRLQRELRDAREDFYFARDVKRDPVAEQMALEAFGLAEGQLRDHLARGAALSAA